MKAPMGSFFFLGPLFLMAVVTLYPHVASPRLAQRTQGIKAPPKWFHFSLTASLKTVLEDSHSSRPCRIRASPYSIILGESLFSSDCGIIVLTVI